MIPAGALTLDDLERLAFTYGGTIERDLSTDTYRLVGALIDGRRYNFGPVSDGADVLAARIGAVS